MACNNPIPAFRLLDNSIVLGTAAHITTPISRAFHVPCGVCTGCRLERSRQWAVRCLHEASLHEKNCFITLTYNDEHLPDCEELNYKHFQSFMRRLRKRRCQKVRFYMCGEYGTEKGRPHYHACLFNYDFDDKKFFKKTKTGSILYTSETLDNLWSVGRGKNKKQLGFATVGEVNFESAAYVARYIMKKQLGRGYNREFIDKETGEVIPIEKEFTKMSLKPGIGLEWFEKFKGDVFPHDICVVRGRECKPPKYYFGKLKECDPDMYEDICYIREKRASRNRLDNTKERLAVKENVLKAKLNQFRRDLE